MAAELPVTYMYNFKCFLHSGLREHARALSRARAGVRWLLIGAVAVIVGGCGGEDDAAAGGGGGSGRSWSISGTPPAQIVQGTAYSFTPVVSNPQSASLSFSYANLPSWATSSASTGTVSGTPGNGTAGTTYSNITLTVTDGTNSYTTPSYSIQVVGTATGSAMLSWMPPTSYTDGSPLTLAGYRVRWGTSQGSYPNAVSISGGLSSYVVTQLTPGTWYFVVTAYDQAQIESVFSNMATKVVN